MLKSDYRRQAIAMLKALNIDQKRQIEKELIGHLIETSEWKNAQTIGVTVSLECEWNTRPIIKAAWEANKVVSIPKAFPKEHRMAFYKMDSFNELKYGHYQLLEPKLDNTFHIKKSEIDLLIVPGLYFDLSGYRVGFGGGYYDRYLKDFSNSTISLTSESFIVEKLPRDRFDVPVDHVLVEFGFIK